MCVAAWLLCGKHAGCTRSHVASAQLISQGTTAVLPPCGQLGQAAGQGCCLNLPMAPLLIGCRVVMPPALLQEQLLYRISQHAEAFTGTCTSTVRACEAGSDVLVAGDGVSVRLHYRCHWSSFATLCVACLPAVTSRWSSVSTTVYTPAGQARPPCAGQHTAYITHTTLSNPSICSTPHTPPALACIALIPGPQMP
jgi:hypothetical protein